MWQSCRLDCRRLINEGEIYPIFNNRWCHGGLLRTWKMTSWRFTRFMQRCWRRNFLSVEDWHEHVQINLGPNVGDITTEYKPARRGRVIPIMSSLYLKPMKTRSVALYEGPGPKGGLRPVDINRHWYVNLCCKIGKSRNWAGHVYEPASGFYKSAGVDLRICRDDPAAV